MGILILTSVRPAHSSDPKEQFCFNWDSGVHLEKQRAGKLIADALYRNYTVLSRRISQRLAHHAAVLSVPTDYFTKGGEQNDADTRVSA